VEMKMQMQMQMKMDMILICAVIGHHNIRNVLL
jgi:hypothetical protein